MKNSDITLMLTFIVTLPVLPFFTRYITERRRRVHDSPLYSTDLNLDPLIGYLK